MKILFLAGAAALSLSACAGIQQAVTDIGVSQAVQQACMAAVAQEIPGITDDMDFDAVMDRLEENGKACLIAAVRDVLTARIIAAAPADAGEVVPADVRAAQAI